MKGSTTYIFIKESDYASMLIRCILSALAGGCRISTDLLIFVIFGHVDPMFILDVDNYRQAQKCLKLFGGVLFSQEVGEAILLNSISDFNIKSIKSDDRVMVFSQTNDPETLSVAQYIKVHASVSHIQNVCEYSSSNIEEDRNLYNFLINNYVDKESTLITGMHDDVYKTGMTLMQSAEALLFDSEEVVAGTLVPMNKRDRMYFSQYNLSSEKFALSLCRIELLRRFTYMCEDGNKELEKWLKEMVVDSKTLWTKGDSFILLRSVISLYKKLMQDIRQDHFQVVLTNDTVFSFIHSLNKKVSNLRGLLEEEKRRIRLMAIMDAVGGVMEENYIETRHENIGTFDINVKNLFRLLAKQNYPSSTYLWELTNFAFREDFIADPQAKRVRSVCLNIWELFFLQKKSDILNLYKVEELTTESLSAETYLKLQTTNVGKLIIEDKIYFKIQYAGNSRELAMSSPLTGFAVVDINSAIETNTEPADLCERSIELQSFLFNYTRCIGGFSKEFLFYIDSQMDEKKKTIEEGRGSNIFTLYPQFRKHIALHINSKENDKRIN